VKDRREFIKTLLVLGGSGALFDPTKALAQSVSLGPPVRDTRAVPHGSVLLPEIQINPFSSEIILNSRLSYHSGYSGSLSPQILANVLWAAARAPLIGSYRIIYAALPTAVYRYDADNHCLVPHLLGNHMSESNVAFEVGVAGDVIEDAGVSLHYAQLASYSFWSTTSNQPVCCPKDSGTNHANSNWNPQSTVHLVNCYGRMNTVNGITAQLAVQSSNGSLPDPLTDGPMLLEDGLADLSYGDQFASGELTLNRISQIAWASYGCNPHDVFGGRAGINVASWVAMYFLTGRIYIVRSTGVDRYHIRLPSGSTGSRDHRIEAVTVGDRRANLRSALPGLPQSAPNYYVFCATDTQTRHLVEAGFAGANALLQATSLGLQGYFNAGFSSSERTSVINALSIPTSDLPLLVFSVG